MTISRLVPLAELGLRAQLNSRGNIAGFVNANGTAVSLAVMAPANTALPAITGTPNVASTLTVSDGTWTGEDLVMSYQWYRDGVAIGGATADTHVLASADLGHAITAAVTATNAADAETASATGGVTALDTVPVNSLAPALTGDGAHGSPVTVDTGTWSGVSNTYTYQWKLDAVAVNGATTNSYTPVVGDVAKALTCLVTATNTGGSASHVSNSVTVS